MDIFTQSHPVTAKTSSGMANLARSLKAGFDRSFLDAFSDGDFKGPQLVVAWGFYIFRDFPPNPSVLATS
jgi:hypothetical protein